MRIAFILLCLTPLLCGQRILYNAGLDKKGQDAAAAAQQISSESVTAAEIANLAVIEKQQIDTALQASLNTMRLQIQSFDTWSNIYGALNDTVTAIKTLTDVTPRANDFSKRKTDIQASASSLKAAIAAKPAPATPRDSLADTTRFVDNVVAHIADVNDLTRLASQIAGSKNPAESKAANQVEDGLKELDDLLKTATAAIAAAKAIKVDPRSLMPSADTLMLSVLAAETDSLKERIAMRARADLENGDVLRLASATMSLMEKMDDQLITGPGCAQPPCDQKLKVSGRLVSASLAEGDIQRKEDLLRILYQAASVAAQNQTVADVAIVRDSIAWRRFELRRNAIYNGSYEQTLQVVGQRISAYYATGIKPNQIAQLLYNLSGLVSLPALAF